MHFIRLGLGLITTLLCWNVFITRGQSQFKTCSDASFCRRYRQWKALNQRPIISVNSISATSTDDSSIYALRLELKSSAESHPNYYLEIEAFRYDGIIRITVDEINTSMLRRRYRIPDGDVVKDLSKLFASSELKRVIREEVEMTTTVNVVDLYRIEVDRDVFKIRVYNSFGNLIQTINSRNLFTFEKYRANSEKSCPEFTEVDSACHPEIDTTGAWTETFRKYTDSKPFGPSAVGIDVTFQNSVNLYGLPEQTMPFRLPLSLVNPTHAKGAPSGATANEEFRMFNSDVFKYQLNSKVALYGSIPMVTAIHGDGESVSGFLWINPSETYVSLTLASGEQSAQSSWVSETGIIDFLVFVGPSPSKVLEQFHMVTGVATLPPIAALGAHQSRWGYPSETVVLEISKKFETVDIPVDFFWLDIQHTNKNRYFTWNPSKFGNPTKLISTLSQQGRKTVAIVDPHVKVDPNYYVYSRALAGEFFIRNAQLKTYEGHCWPGTSSYLDFSQSSVRSFWASLFDFEKYIGSSPDLYIWNDMNEPTVFDVPELTLPRDALHGNGVEHREVHNLFGMYFHRATYEGLVGRSGGQKRPFVLSRSFFAGSHRYGPVWTGDNTANWAHLKASIPMLLSMSVCGMSFTGADVGGFFDHPSKELFIRWHQLGALAYPFYRSHSHIDNPPREPWVYDDETVSAVRAAVKLRYSLLPYYYTQFAMYALRGLPIIRPIWFDHYASLFANMSPDISTAIEEQLFVGESILVRGIYLPASLSVNVYLPCPDCVWYDFHTVSAPHPGGQLITLSTVPLGPIPVFVKGGSIIPMKRTSRSSTRDMRHDPISLRIYGDVATGLVYLDDEESLEYANSDNYILIKLMYSNSRLTAVHLEGTLQVESLHVECVELVSLTSTCSSDISECKMCKGPFEISLLEDFAVPIYTQ